MQFSYPIVVVETSREVTTPLAALDIAAAPFNEVCALTVLLIRSDNLWYFAFAKDEALGCSVATD